MCFFVHKRNSKFPSCRMVLNACCSVRVLYAVFEHSWDTGTGCFRTRFGFGGFYCPLMVGVVDGSRKRLMGMTC